MDVAAGCGRPLGEPQMEPSVSYLANVCDLSCIHICRLLSTHSATESCFWCRERSGGENGQSHLVLHRYSCLLINRYWPFVKTEIKSSWFALPLKQWMHFYRIHFIQSITEVGGRLCLSVCLSVCLCLLRYFQKVRNRFGWYVADRAISAKITLFTFGQEPDLGCLPS